MGAGDSVLLISGLNGLAAPWRAVADALAPRFRMVTLAWCMDRTVVQNMMAAVLVQLER